MCVQIVSSTHSGMGKSFYIKRLTEQLGRSQQVCGSHITVPIHGPTVTAEKVMSYLNEFKAESISSVLHLDVASNVGTSKVEQIKGREHQSKCL